MTTDKSHVMTIVAAVVPIGVKDPEKEMSSTLCTKMAATTMNLSTNLASSTEATSYFGTDEIASTISSDVDLDDFSISFPNAHFANVLLNFDEVIANDIDEDIKYSLRSYSDPANVVNLLLCDSYSLGDQNDRSTAIREARLANGLLCLNDEVAPEDMDESIKAIVRSHTDPTAMAEQFLCGDSFEHKNAMAVKRDSQKKACQIQSTPHQEAHIENSPIFQNDHWDTIISTKTILGID